MKLWDRITGREEEKIRSRYDVRIRGIEEQHAQEIDEIQSLLIEHGFILYKKIEGWIEMTTFGDSYQHRIPGMWRWDIKEIDPSCLDYTPGDWT